MQWLLIYEVSHLTMNFLYVGMYSLWIIPIVLLSYEIPKCKTIIASALSKTKIWLTLGSCILFEVWGIFNVISAICRFNRNQHKNKRTENFVRLKELTTINVYYVKYAI